MTHVMKKSNALYFHANVSNKSAHFRVRHVAAVR
jgi:hypothetical protein